MRRAMIVAAALLGGCLPEVRETPEAPSTAALIERFTAGADGVLDAASTTALVRGLIDDLVVIAAAVALVAEVDATATGLDEADDPGSGSNALTAEGAVIGERRHALSADAGAWAEVTHICPGVDGSLDPANGRLRLRTVLADFDEQISAWGEADGCRVSGSEGPATIDADINSVFRRADSALYVEVIGDLRDAAAPLPFALALQSLDGAVTLHRIVEGSGSFLIGVDRLEDGRGAVSVRDALGEWLCTYAQDPLRGTCRRGAEVLQWP